MINSRDLKELHPTVAGKAYTFVERCRQAGIDLLTTVKPEVKDITGIHKALFF